MALRQPRPKLGFYGPDENPNESKGLIPDEYMGLRKAAKVVPTQEDVLRSEFIRKKLPEYFGVKAVEEQRSIIKGRHPQSMKRESELWHYARSSNERHERIKRGHGFWNVIQDTTHKQMANIETTVAPDGNVAATMLSPSQQKVKARKRRSINEDEREVFSSYFPAITEAVNSSPRHASTHEQTHALKQSLKAASSVHSMHSLASNSSVGSDSLHSRLSGSTLAPNSSIAGLTTSRPPGTRGSQLTTSVASSTDGHNKEKAHNTQLRGSLQTQLKNAMAKNNTDLNLKIDFQHRSLINYNMTFLIMNDHEEVLYFDDVSQQFHVKYFQDLQPSDKAKFKVIDVTNPSNPAAVKFGDDIWLQVLTLASSDGDEKGKNEGGRGNSEKRGHHHHHESEELFQFGSVLTTKVYLPIEVPQVKYDTDFLTSSMLHSSQELLENHQRILRSIDPKKYDKKSNKLALIPPPPPHHHHQTAHNSRQPAVPYLHQDMSFMTSFASLTTAASTTSLLSNDDSVGSADSQYFNNDDNSVVTESKYKDPHAKRLSRQQEYHQRMKPCGQIQMSRMIDPKKIENLPENISLPDDKCTRYLSKDTLHLGRWTIHTAVRMDDEEQVYNHILKYISGGGKLGKRPKAPDGSTDLSGFTGEIEVSNNNQPNQSNLKDKINTHVLSLTPIIFQQDQYCLSSVGTKEYVDWPPDSTYIVNHSEKINSQLAKEYEDEYHQFLQTNGNHLDVLNLPSFKQKQNNNHQNNTLPLNIRRVRTANSRAKARSNKKSVTFQSQLSQHHPPPGQQNQHQEGEVGCLRRLLHRSVPYEYTIDRRSVWRICLFEQFSDNYLQTKKDKEVKKVMETANMVLKLSKMNREGAKVHIAENHIEHLPPLTSGEEFVHSLREIRWKKQFQRSTEQLNTRRMSEFALDEYFNARISDVLQQEEKGFQKNRLRLRSNQELFDSSNASLTYSISKSYDQNDLISMSDSKDSLPLENYHYHLLEGGGSSGSALKQKRSKKKEEEKYLTSEHPPHSDEIFTMTSAAVDSNYFSLNSRQSLALKQKKTVKFPAIAPTSSQQQQRQGMMAANKSVTSLSSASRKSPSHQHHQHRSDRGGVDVNSVAGSAAGNTDDDDGSVVSLLSMSSIGGGVGGGVEWLDDVASHHSQPSGTSGSSPSHLRHNRFSEDVHRTFNTSIIAPYDRPLILNSAQAVHEFSQFTEGERLVSLHKTMKHINKVAKVRESLFTVYYCMN